MIEDNNEEKIMLFENALYSSNKFIRQAAADELAILMLNGSELSIKTKDLMRKEASPWWVTAFEITAQAVAGRANKEKILSYLLDIDHTTAISFSAARQYTLQELKKYDVSFTNYEEAVIEAHYAVSHLRFNDALSSFRIFRTGNNWPAQIPAIFVQYPNLINDLGRTFEAIQSSRNEGIALFVQWEAQLNRQNSRTTEDLRYRLLFYAGRVTRRIGQTQNAQAVTFFERALPLAPDYEQQDACIWYILDLSMGGPVNVIMERYERLVPLWHSGSYYNTLTERYLHRLVSVSDWSRIIRTFELIKDVNGINIKAGYAWVIARAIQERYLSEEERRLAARALNTATAEVNGFMRFAYNAVDNLAMPGIYYRMQSADVLGLPYLVFSNNVPPVPDSPVLQFLLGFFHNGAANLVNPYIRSLERNLSTDELRAVAQALDEARLYPQSMRVVTIYINREGYRRNRRDLELMYPRPYLELIERNAKHFNIKPPLLFGLIRTESAFQSAIGSHAGAVGLAQLMPATAREQADIIRRRGGPDFFTADNTIDRTDPDANVYIGSFYYNYLLSRFDNNEQLALMSYNGGQGRVRRWFTASTFPVDLFVETVTIYETRDYGRRVPAIGRIYEELYYK
ncbi:MAG: lytic transglycosylase domain-containing protein [Treponema sp.]|nr:lytic transglycosylase domain-containing protein [Treponema sp.]